MNNRNFIIGTRGSELALWQATHFQSLLTIKTELAIIKTSGDQILNIPLQGRTEKGFFTKEIEDALLANKIDFAVHSLKDLPTKQPLGLRVGAVLKRGPVSDLLLVREEAHNKGALFPVKPKSRIGAGSLRRQALLNIYAPDCTPELLRGNVPTRIQKLLQKEYDAIILAKAGVERLNLKTPGLHVYELNPNLWIPAPGQGAVAIEIRDNDKEAQALLSPLNDPFTEQAVKIERQLLENFEGGCHTAFGALSAPVSDNLWQVTFGIHDQEKFWRQKTNQGPASSICSDGPLTLHTLNKCLSDPKQKICTPYNI